MNGCGPNAKERKEFHDSESSMTAKMQALLIRRQRGGKKTKKGKKS